jgi:hypothetical protein
LELFHRLTGDAHRSHTIHFILIFPGVFLHELSHWLVLRLLGVRCSLHLGIEMQADFVVYGHVDYYESDVGPVKHFLSGIAPLITGMLLISLLAVQWMGIPGPGELARQEAVISLQSVSDTLRTWQFWLAFYLIFAITSEMVPSPSDRKYWLPLGLLLVGILFVAVITRTSGWLFANLFPYINNWLKLMGVVFVIGMVPQLVFWLPFQLLKAFRRRNG